MPPKQLGDRVTSSRLMGIHPSANHQQTPNILTYVIDARTMRTATDACKGHRRRRRSASPARMDYNHLLGEHDAEEERRSHLSLKEKMAKNGRQLQRRLERNPGIMILLQPSPSGLMGKAQCRARDCLFEGRSPRQETNIAFLVATVASTISLIAVVVAGLFADSGLMSRTSGCIISIILLHGLQFGDDPLGRQAVISI